MATIKVEGTVNRLFWNDRGVEILEEYTARDGEKSVIKTRKYTAWFEEAVNFSMGAKGIFEGTLSSTIEKWEKEGQPVLDKRTGEQGVSVKLAINSATFTSTSSAPREQAPMQHSDETPF